mgnify:CR=1 FL=1
MIAQLATEIGDYELALKIDQNYAPAFYYLGMHHKAAGNKKEAKAAFQKAVEHGGDKGEPWRRMFMSDLATAFAVLALQ